MTILSYFFNCYMYVSIKIIKLYNSKYFYASTETIMGHLFILQLFNVVEHI